VPEENTPTSVNIPRPQLLTERALSALERFSHIEAVSGIVLLMAALVALAWANSPYAISYEHYSKQVFTPPSQA
jgi:Na+:H+ antiporter, NhaA family